MPVHLGSICYHPISACLRNPIAVSALKMTAAITAAAFSRQIPIKPLAGACFGGATFTAWGSLPSVGFSAVQMVIGSALSAGGWAVADTYKDVSPAFRLIGYAGWMMGAAAAHYYSRCRPVPPLGDELILRESMAYDSATL